MSNGENNIGRMMANALRGEVGMQARRGTSTESNQAVEIGDAIRISKREVKSGAQSSVAAGSVFAGTITGKIELGKPFKYGSGTTSPVQAVRVEGDVLVIETETSVYEVRKV